MAFGETIVNYLSLIWTNADGFRVTTLVLSSIFLIFIVLLLYAMFKLFFSRVPKVILMLVAIAIVVGIVALILGTTGGLGVTEQLNAITGNNSLASNETENNAIINLLGGG